MGFVKTDDYVVTFTCIWVIMVTKVKFGTRVLDKMFI